MDTAKSNFKLHPSTSVAHVALQVVDLDNMLAFYRGLLGFQLLSNDGQQASLSANGKLPSLLTLSERKDARSQPSSTSGVGLYHTALRFPSRMTLATTLLRVLAGNWPLQGAADHHVSEAIYFADPEGNGIEIYRDRPRVDWPKLQDGIQMGNAPLDLDRLIEEADEAAAELGAIDPGTDIGHMHLQVSNLATAHAFYHELLGLDVMMSMPTALFISAGGYHHHLGLNTWHSLNAPRREKDLTGLQSFALLIPDQSNWMALLTRLASIGKGLQSVEHDRRLGVSLEDQDGIRVELLTPATEPVSQALSPLKSPNLN